MFEVNSLGMGSQVGVFGDDKASEIALFMLHKMMNRAKRSSGITASYNGVHETIKGNDTPRKIISPHIDVLKGLSAIGAALSSTEFLSKPESSVPPVQAMMGSGYVSATLDGEIFNHEALRIKMDARGAIMQQDNLRDELFLHMVARKPRPNLEEKLFETLRTIKGNFSVVGMIGDKGFAAVTPQETFSLYALQSKSKTFIASEPAAFQIVERGYMSKRHTMFQLQGGLLYLIDKGQIQTQKFGQNSILAHCIHEYVRFQNPSDPKVAAFKESLGASLLDYLSPQSIRNVTGVPNSSNHFVNGLLNSAAQQGSPYNHIVSFMRNSYSGQKVLGADKGKKVEFHTKYTVVKQKPKLDWIIIVKDTLRTGESAREEIAEVREHVANHVIYATIAPPMESNCLLRPDFIYANDHIGALHANSAIAKQIGADVYVHLPLSEVFKRANEHLGLNLSNSCWQCYDAK